MRVSDYLVEYLAATLGIRHVFGITGGHCAYIMDSLSRRKHEKGDIELISVQHEQAGAMAAEMYSRLSPNGLGAMVVTSGPGATNMLTGICCAWFDSIPALYISGQVNTYESKGDLAVRQIGFQETETVTIYKSVTKYAVRVEDPQRIRYELEKAVYLAKSGRPGPVLLDIPMNVSRTEIDPSQLESYVPEETQKTIFGPDLKKKVHDVFKLLASAQRPVILVGGGVRIGRAMAEIKGAIDLLGIPFMVSWSGFDIIPHDHSLFVGAIGVYGSRGANFALQNADVLISLGSRLESRQTSVDARTFARAAKKVIVDIDAAELHKNRVVADIEVHADVKSFLACVIDGVPKIKKTDIAPWVERTRVWRSKYPVCLPEYAAEKGAVNAYVFLKILSEELEKGAVIVPDCGGNLVWTMQSLNLKDDQRVISAMGNSPMGYALAASMGASFAKNKGPVVCIIGDGGMQVNIQELQTIFAHQLPLKVFLLNSHSYAITKQFEDENFGGVYGASDSRNGYTVPDFIKVAQAYGLATEMIKDHADDMREKIRKTLAHAGPIVCEVNIKDNQRLAPKGQVGQPIENLGPPLPREEFLANMIIPPYEQTENYLTKAF